MSISASAPLSSTQDPLAEYHAKLSQHLNALLSSSSPGASSSASSSPTVQGGRTGRPAGTLTRRTESIGEASQLNTHGSTGETSSLRQRAHSPNSSSFSSSHSAQSGSRSKRRSSRQVQAPTSPREATDGQPNFDLTARPDKRTPVLQYPAHEEDEEAPPLVHHRNNTSSSQSGPTDAIASPPEVISPVASPAERLLSRESLRRGPRTPAHDHVDLGPVDGSPEQVESREEEHKRAWKADGARVWKTLPEGFTLNLDKRSRRSSDESKDGTEEREQILTGLRKDSTPKPLQQLPSTSPLGPSPPLSSGQKSGHRVHLSNGRGSPKQSGPLHRDSLRNTNGADLASKMGLVVSTPSPSANLTPLKFTFGKFNQHVEPVPQSKPDVLADINGRLRFPTDQMPRGQRSPLNPAVQSGQEKSQAAAPSTPGADAGKASARLGSGPTIMGPSFSIPRPKSKMAEPPKAQARALASPQTPNGRATKDQKIQELRDAFAEDDVDEEYEARREIRLKRRQVDLRRRIGVWASAVSVVDNTVPEIDPTPPSPSVATAAMRVSPLVASPLIPAFSSPHSEKSRLSLSIVPETQSTSSRSTSSSRRKSKPKSTGHSRHDSNDKPQPETQGPAPKLRLKSSMFTYSTSIDDSSRRMRAIDALLGDMSLKGSNLNPSRTSADAPGSTTYSGVLDRSGGLDGAMTPIRESKSKEAPSSLNPRDHTHVSSQVDLGERAKEIKLLTEFSTAIDLTTGAGFSPAKKTNVEVREGMPTPKAKGLQVTGYTEIE